ncbi:unnamed protein product [Adineta steineri]|uniref:Uncharacterized protein n=1 Tax=Adineta steineri TaxID=433720 RepID=A0A818P2R7_9BILA|nr:unnamed protein product [Adineta steineri]
MAKIFLYTLLLICTLNQASSEYPDGNEEIMIASNRLHRGTDQLKRRVNPLVNVMKSSSYNQFKRNQKPVLYEQQEAEPDTFYVQMNIDSDVDVDEDEPLETKYVDVIIDTKRNVNTYSYNRNG